MPNLIQVRRILSRGGVVETQTFSDDFNRANENLNANANWTLLAGTDTDLTVASNQVATGVTTPSGSYAACPDCGDEDQYIQWTNRVTSSGRLATFLCYVDVDNHMFCWHSSGTEARISVKAAGVATTRINATIVLTSGDVFKARRLGSTVELYENAGLIGSYTLTAGEITALTGGTRAGIRNFTSAATILDNFSHGTVA
jgi:hypothetical protein